MPSVSRSATLRLCSSATCAISASTSAPAATPPDVASAIVSPTKPACTSRSSIWRSNVSITPAMEWTSIVSSAAPRPDVTCAMDAVTVAIWAAPSSLDATASTRDASRRYVSDWDWWRMAFSAWMRAPSVLPFSSALRSLTFSDAIDEVALVDSRLRERAVNFMSKMVSARATKRERDTQIRGGGGSEEQHPARQSVL